MNDITPQEKCFLNIYRRKYGTDYYDEMEERLRKNEEKELTWSEDE